MLGVNTFYFSINRKMTAVFGTIFNDISVPRFDANGAITQLLHVPISYGPKERVEALAIDNKDEQKQSAVSPLPRLSFEQRPPTFDPDRMLNPAQTASVVRDAATGSYQRQYEPVPYNFNFTLWIYSKDIEDGNKILEQILPFFTPSFVVTVDLIPQMNQTVDIPVTLNSVNLEDTYEGNFTGDRRAIIWTLDFTMKGYYYGPITEDAIIKFATINFYIPAGNNTIAQAVNNTNPSVVVTSQPGLTANGQPTSNIAQTIPYLEINATDPYGYITIIRNTDPQEDTGGNQSNNLSYQG